MSTYTQDGPEAQWIASHIPYYPFHGIDRFYDISGMTHNPEVFKKVVEVFVARYKDYQLDAIAGLDARGFVMGPPIALALNLPFIMIRKEGKLPNAITANERYKKEYDDSAVSGKTQGEALCVSRTAVKPGMRILVIDDLVATGGTLIAACNLLASLQANIVECACMVELKALNGYGKLKALHPTVEVYGLISEDILNLKGDLA